MHIKHVKNPQNVLDSLKNILAKKKFIKVQIIVSLSKICMANITKLRLDNFIFYLYEILYINTLIWRVSNL